MIVDTMSPFVVYTHTLDGKVFYVGKGPHDRAFSTRSRNVLWRVQTAARAFEVEIVSRHETDAEARSAEIELIQKLKPRCNKFHNGWAIPEERRAAMSEQRKGVKRRPEHAQFMREGWSKAIAEGRYLGRAMHAVRCKETGEVFRSISLCCQSMGLDKTSVRHCAQGKRKSHHGYTFEYVTDPAPVANRQKEKCCRKAEDPLHRSE